MPWLHLHSIATEDTTNMLLAIIVLLLCLIAGSCVVLGTQKRRAGTRLGQGLAVCGSLLALISVLLAVAPYSKTHDIDMRTTLERDSVRLLGITVSSTFFENEISLWMATLPINRTAATEARYWHVESSTSRGWFGQKNTANDGYPSLPATLWQLYQEGGVTQQECVAVLQQWTEFLARQPDLPATARLDATVVAASKILAPYTGRPAAKPAARPKQPQLTEGRRTP